jgi:hypothetical protein
VRCGAVRCGAVRCGAVRCGAVRCGAVRCGAVRFIRASVWWQYVFGDGATLPFETLVHLTPEALAEQLVAAGDARPGRQSACPSLLHSRVLLPCWHSVPRCRPLWDTLIAAFPSDSECHLSLHRDSIAPC